MLHKTILTIATAVSAAVAAYAAPAESDSARYVTALKDVEVVGLKQMPDRNDGLETVVEGSQIQQFRIKTVRNMSEVTPNFFVPQYGSRMTSSIYVRGLGSRIDQPVVGLNVDNVPYLNKDSYDFDLVDIKKIEVLRGTRAVLNGRNSMAGQVNIYTLSPWDYQGFRVKADFGRANTGTAAASWYGRISPRLATSVMGRIATTDGFYKNEQRPYDRDCGRETQAAFRWKLSWHPDSRWSLANTLHTGFTRQGGYPYENIETQRIEYNDTAFYRRFSISDGLSVSYTGERMVATSLTSVQYLDDNMTLDQDFRPQSIFTLTQKRREWALTQDIFAKGLRGDYEWLMGVFGFYKPTDMKAPVTFGDDGIRTLIEDNVNSQLPGGMKLEWDERKMLLGSTFKIHNGGFALYHQSTYRLGNVTFQGGLRWEIERIAMDYTSRVNTSATMKRPGPGGVMIPLGTREIRIDTTGHVGQTFNQLLPQVSVTWTPGIWEVRAAVAKGYRAGGYNTQMFSDILMQQMMQQMGQTADYDVSKIISYKPEKAWTYELTAGLTTADNRFSLQATGFLMTCRDQQLTIFPDGNTTGRAMTNAGRTRSAGAELTMSWTPDEAWCFRASYGYTDARFTRYNNGLQDLRHKRLPYAPAHTLFASADYVLPFTFIGITPSVNVNTRAAGDIFWDDANTRHQKFYATLNASVCFEHRLCSIRFWGTNLTNTRYTTFSFTSIGHEFIQRANPWSVGATLLLRFASN